MNNEKNKRIDAILNSLDGAQKANVPPFFYTRLKGRMESRLVSDSPVQQSWLLKPVFAVLSLVIILTINAVVIFQKTNNSNTTTDTDVLQSIAAEYRLNDNNTALFETNQDK